MPTGHPFWFTFSEFIAL